MLNKILADPAGLAAVILTFILVILMFINGIMFLQKKENRKKLKNEFTKECKSIFVSFKMFIKGFSTQFQKGYFHVLRLPSIFNFLNTCINYAWILMGVVLIVSEIMETKEFIELVETNPDFINMIAINLLALANTILGLLSVGFFVKLAILLSSEDYVSIKRIFKKILRALYYYFINNIVCSLLLRNFSFNVNQYKLFSIFIASLILWASFRILSSLINHIVCKRISLVKICGGKVVVQLDDCIEDLLHHTKSEIIYNETKKETYIDTVRLTFRICYSFKDVSFNITRVNASIGNAVIVDRNNGKKEADS